MRPCSSASSAAAMHTALHHQPAMLLLSLGVMMAQRAHQMLERARSQQPDQARQAGGQSALIDGDLQTACLAGVLLVERVGQHGQADGRHQGQPGDRPGLRPGCQQTVDQVAEHADHHQAQNKSSHQRRRRPCSLEKGIEKAHALFHWVRLILAASRSACRLTISATSKRGGVLPAMGRRLFDDLPQPKQIELLNFARYLRQQATDEPHENGVALHGVSADALARLTGIVALGGDAVEAHPLDCQFRP
jgi:hypothetical protein